MAVGNESFDDWWQRSGLQSVQDASADLRGASRVLEDYQRTGNLASLRSVIELTRERGWSAIVVQDEVADATLIVIRAGVDAVVFNASVAPSNGNAVERSNVGDFLRLRRSRCFGKAPA